MKTSSSIKFAALLVAASLAACGGGGGSAGTPISGGGSNNNGNGTGTGNGNGTGTDPGTGGPAQVVPSALIVTVDKATINNSGSDKALLTVTAVNAARNPIPDATVSVQVDSGAIFTPAGASGSTTDGTYSGNISIGSDKSNRLIRYTASSGGVSSAGTIQVTGTNVVARLAPSTSAPGQPVALTVSSKDSSSMPISGTAVAASGIPNVMLSPMQTDINGQTTTNFAAPAAEGIYTLTVVAGGVTTTTALNVVRPGSTTVAPAVGIVSGASVIANPVVIAANAPNSATNTTELRALFVSNTNVPIPRVRVRFYIDSSDMPGASLTNGSNLVYSDAAGYATTSYIAGSTSSPTNGVKIRACYSLDDFADGTCPNPPLTTQLTVTANPVALTIGNDNVITKSPTGISYIKKFEIQAVNAAGNYAPDVPLSAVVDIEGYWKGAPVPNPPTNNTNDFPGYKFCLNEDKNRNGVNDAGEDINGDGELTPRKSDVAIGFPAGNRTDANGLALLQLQYPQNLATWLRVKITVTAGVSGSEGAATYQYVLRAAQEDASNGAFLRPPFGSDNSPGGCSNTQ